MRNGYYYLFPNHEQECWELREVTATSKEDPVLARFYDGDQTISALGRMVLHTLNEEKTEWNLGLPLFFLLCGMMILGLPGLLQAPDLETIFNLLGFFSLLIGMLGGCLEMFKRKNHTLF